MKNPVSFPTICWQWDPGGLGTCCFNRGHADDISINFFLFLKGSQIETLEKTYCALLLFPRGPTELLPKFFLLCQISNKPINEVCFRAFENSFVI